MPWNKATVMDQRIEFVIRARNSLMPFAQLCREFGISRTTGYLWKDRFEQAGSLNALNELSRRPHSSPNKTAEELEARILKVRDEKGWGARKIEVVLEKEGLSLPWPTIHRVLVRNGRVGVDGPSSKATRRFEYSQSNQLTQMDFKGEYPIEGGKCYPLSLIDDHSRYLLGLWPLSSTKAQEVYESLKGLFKSEGVPQAILTDHGTTWYSTTNGHGLTWLSVWLIKQGVKLIYSGVGHPQTQGKIERYHRTLDERTRHRGIPATRKEWVEWAEDYRQEYNNERPHEAIGMKVPSQVYTRDNLREYIEEPPEWEYSGGEVERLNRQGSLSWKGKRYFVCEALASERVRVDEVEGMLIVTYREMTVREIELETGKSRAVILESKREEQTFK